MTRREKPDSERELETVAALTEQQCSRGRPSEEGLEKNRAQEEEEEEEEELGKFSCYCS